MKAYKCDICGAFFAKRLCPTLPNGLMIAGSGLGSADICAGCLETLRNTVSDLSLVTEKNRESLLSHVTEENNEFKTSSGEC